MALTDIVFMPGEDWQAILDAVRAKTGGTELLKSGDVPAEVKSISGDGIDTSDATATAEDMAEGVTAYVNGEKITGTILTREADGSKYGWKTATPYKLTSSEHIGLYKEFNTDTLYRKGSMVGLTTEPSNFGDATAEDVAKGKTFTSAAGLKAVGTHECDTGLDTSDATATAEDMAEGITAYVNGEKVTGSLPVASEDSYSSPECNWDSSLGGLELIAEALARKIVEKGCAVSMYCAGDNLGDAEAADVAEGKTFTSAAGLKVTGTKVDAGGLAVKTGTTTSTTIETGLSSVKHFVIFKASVTGTGLVFGMLRGDTGIAHYVSSIYCSSYSSYLQNYAFTNGAISGVDHSGGTVTWEPTTANYGLTSGVTYTWYAFGTE